MPMVQQPTVPVMIPALLLTAAGFGRSPCRADDAAFTLDEPTRQQCLAVLEAGLAGDEFWPAMHAAEALTLSGRAATVREHLGPLLDQEPDDQRRCGLARELVRAGDPAGIALLAGILAGATPHGHTHAAESLFKIDAVGDEAALRRHMEQTDRPPLRIMAAAALARSGDSTALEAVHEMLREDDPQIFRLAAWVLGVVGGPADIEPLRSRLTKAADEQTRAFVQHALARLGDRDGRAAVALNLDSADPQVRPLAALAAGESRACETAARLRTMLDDPWLDARIRAAHALLLLGQAGQAVPGNDRHPDPAGHTARPARQ